MPRKLSHYDRTGKARMVDVSDKSVTSREAEASAFVVLKPKVLKALPKNPKGDPLEVARLAGIMAAKQTSNLIPMCHPLALAHVEVNMRLCENGVAIASKVTTTAATGVEMEALVAASVAALTVYDMCKALDKGIEIREIVLERKSGGKSGDYSRARRNPERSRQDFAGEGARATLKQHVDQRQSAAGRRQPHGAGDAEAVPLHHGTGSHRRRCC